MAAPCIMVHSFARYENCQRWSVCENLKETQLIFFTSHSNNFSNSVNIQSHSVGEKIFNCIRCWRSILKRWVHSCFGICSNTSGSNRFLACRNDNPNGLLSNSLLIVPMTNWWMPLIKSYIWTKFTISAFLSLLIVSVTAKPEFIFPTWIRFWLLDKSMYTSFCLLFKC